MAKRCYYEILGVEKAATEETIKKNYRKLAMLYHPDRNPDNREAEDKFKEAAEAYEILSDPAKRQRYDRFGHEGLKGSDFQGFSSFDDIFSNFNDIFSDFFGTRHQGRSRTRTSARPGADLRYDLTISFMDAAMGVAMDIDVAKNITCQECSGTGSEPGKKPIICSRCNGRGQVLQSQGFFSISSTCPQCHGHGQMITHPCPSCRGSGRTKITKTVNLKIPAGVETGSRLRLRSEGEAGENGGPNGDLYVFLDVEPHEFFDRQDDNLYCQISISFTQAALGTKVEIPTLTGSEKLKIPKGTQPGAIFRLKGKGISHLRGAGRGDQIIETVVTIPKDLTKRQEELLNEFASLE
ncbi:MAG: molecular chaperone DnaJ [Syntrophobacterales bacterium]|jgi:molecular chaperone DnaJ|nr:molecular chaperone DnaJ [Syntrophobacterales bacterium]